MKTSPRQLLLAALLSAASFDACGESTVDADHPFVYGANVGWLNARPSSSAGAVVGLTYCTGFLWSPTCGWIGLGNTPTNGWRYTQSSASDWGVNHDGEGALTGFAYGANIGWITFEQSYGKPRVDLRSGALTGFAWSPSIGWIGFSNALAFVRAASLATAPDSDADGIPDAWEYRRAGRLTALHGGGADADGDGVPDASEYRADTDPYSTAEALTILAFDRSGATDRLTWTVRPTRHYRLETNASLAAGPTGWTDSGLGLLTDGGGGTLQRQLVAATATSRFYRVRAVLPLSE